PEVADQDPLAGVCWHNQVVVETRRWTFELQDGWHHLEVQGDSLWTDRPSPALLDGRRLTIAWRRTTSWWRNWNVARWEWEFQLGAHAGMLLCEKRQPPSAATRGRLILRGTPKAV